MITTINIALKCKKHCLKFCLSHNLYNCCLKLYMQRFINVTLSEFRHKGQKMMPIYMQHVGHVA